MPDWHDRRMDAELYGPDSIDALQDNWQKYAQRALPKEVYRDGPEDSEDS